MRAFSARAVAIVTLWSFGLAHMEMKYPPPFRSKFNNFTSNIDYSMTSPLSSSGSNFPCKGYHKLVGTPQGQSVATWTPGQSYSMIVTGGAAHNGGSCQASLSFDGGKSWKVIRSYIGNCPILGDSSYSFTIPSNTPAGTALFAWSWFNQVGNREMYMNCAAITIGVAANMSPKARTDSDSDSISSRPIMFVANIGNGCSTVEGKDLLFPQPGPDVKNTSQNTASPVGNCAQ